MSDVVQDTEGHLQSLTKQGVGGGLTGRGVGVKQGYMRVARRSMEGTIYLQYRRGATINVARCTHGSGDKAKSIECRSLELCRLATDLLETGHQIGARWPPSPQWLNWRGIKRVKETACIDCAEYHH